MSSILKALRKLEEEKAALGEGGVDLSRDILKRSAPQRSSGNPLLLKVVLVTVLTIALIALLWVLLGSTEQTETVAVSAAVVRADNNPVTPPAPVPQAVQPEPAVERKALSELVPIPAKVKTEEPVKPAEVSVEEPQVVVVKIEPEVIPSPEAKTVETVKKPVVVTPAAPKPEVVEAVEPVAEPAPAVVPEQTPLVETLPTVAVPQPVAPEQTLPEGLPELWVSAIAFKPQPGERLAVVNDLPVMEGTSVDGVQIVEILETGVRFSWQGMEFVLPLTDEPPQ